MTKYVIMISRTNTHIHIHRNMAQMTIDKLIWHIKDYSNHPKKSTKEEDKGEKIKGQT